MFGEGFREMESDESATAENRYFHFYDAGSIGSLLTKQVSEQVSEYPDGCD